MSASVYVVRVEDFGRLVREVACADFRDAIETAIRLAREYPNYWVSPYRPDNIDLGMPTGLTRDEVDAWWEVMP